VTEELRREILALLESKAAAVPLIVLTVLVEKGGALDLEAEAEQGAHMLLQPPPVLPQVEAGVGLVTTDPPSWVLPVAKDASSFTGDVNVVM
jgi:hypothetical protein